MTIRYLRQGFTGDFSGGRAQVQFTAANGQFWMPRLIRVGLTLTTASPSNPNPAPPQLACQLYHGGVGDVTADAFVDSTSNGAGDVTGLLNGTLIQPGEIVTAVWNPLDTGGSISNPGIAYLEIIGVSTDTITEATAQLANTSPGSPFRSALESASNLPPAAHNGISQTFSNPGQNNSVNIFIADPAAKTYLYALESQPFQTFTGAEGDYNFGSGSRTDIQVMFVNPFSFLGPTIMEYHGLAGIPNDAFRFTQRGNAAINSMSYNVTVLWRNFSV